MDDNWEDSLEPKTELAKQLLKIRKRIRAKGGNRPFEPRPPFEGGDGFNIYDEVGVIGRFEGFEGREYSEYAALCMNQYPKLKAALEECAALADAQNNQEIVSLCREALGEQDEMERQ